MEKVKIGQEKFELTVNGVDPFTEGTLVLSFLPGEKTLREIEELLSDPQNTKRIEVINENEETEQVFIGYDDLQVLKIAKDQKLEYLSEEGVRRDVITAALKEKSLKESVTILEKGQQTQDGAIADLAEIVGAMAEGGMA
ncbi:MAG: hypothetical protein KHW68_08910 [Lachnospiraceae bacterium]|nr:hypothetical protein [Lachnospiraceae bacterium]